MIVHSMSREQTDFFEKCVLELARCDIVVDLGAGWRFRKKLASYQNIFENNYFSMDIQFNSKLDYVGNIQQLPMGSASVDGVICLYVLEHVPNPWRAMEEIFRILSPGGIALFGLPFIHVYHGNTKSCADYYRFSRDATRHLFREFSEVQLQPIEDAITAPLSMLIGYNLFSRLIGGCLSGAFKLITGRWPGGELQVGGYTIFARK